MTKLRKAIFLAGHFDRKNTSMWEEWFTTIDNLFKEYGLFAHRIGVSGEGYTGRIYCRNRLLKRLNKSFKEKKILRVITLYSYDPKHEHINNDDMIVFCRESFNNSFEYIWCEFNEDTFSDEEIDKIVLVLERFIDMTYGELIQQNTSTNNIMFISRVMNYDLGDGPADERRRKRMDLTTLKIIKEESIPRQY
ncbi:hypothetical protein [Megamonas funiformis]|uniref:hypothetical protein n=1 Tax=Megamonas funiformis TaxID=437897 RepID=UPI00224CFED8|nr:hypothetical protein [Megamonas funiformis]MCX4131471.1 hypothetical protein [Megamonas funiformis]